MVIEPEVDQATRALLGYAISGDEEGFASSLQAMSDERYLHCLGLCVRVAGYIAIDACSWQWPAEADLLAMAQRITGMDALDFGVSEADNYAFLARSAIGFEPLSEVFPDRGKLGSIPIFATATLLTAYSPDGKRWHEYLTVVERSLDLVAPLPEETVPALLLSARRHRALTRVGANLPASSPDPKTIPPSPDRSADLGDLAVADGQAAGDGDGLQHAAIVGD